MSSWSFPKQECSLRKYGRKFWANVFGSIRQYVNTLAQNFLQLKARLNYQIFGEFYGLIRPKLKPNIRSGINIDFLFRILNICGSLPNLTVSPSKCSKTIRSILRELFYWLDLHVIIKVFDSLVYFSVLEFIYLCWQNRFAEHCTHTVFLIIRKYVTNKGKFMGLLTLNEMDYQLNYFAFQYLLPQSYLYEFKHF